MLCQGSALAGSISRMGQVAAATRVRCIGQGLFRRRARLRPVRHTRQPLDRRALLP